MIIKMSKTEYAELMHDIKNFSCAYNWLIDFKRKDYISKGEFNKFNTKYKKGLIESSCKRMKDNKTVIAYKLGGKNA